MTSSTQSSYTSIWVIRVCKSSSSSSISMVMSFPFSAIDNLPNRGLLGDTWIGPIVFLSFYGHGVRGDFGTSGVAAASLGSFWARWGSAVTSVNHTLVLAGVIMSTLEDCKSTQCLMLCTCSILKQPSVVL